MANNKLIKSKDYKHFWRFFQQITDDFLRESGMANIDMDKRDPGQAIKW